MQQRNQLKIVTVIGRFLVGLALVMPTYSSAHEGIGNWIVNSDDERSLHMLDEAEGEGVLVNVQSISTETIDQTDYVRIEASGIPNYRVTVDQPLLDLLSARPKSQADFFDGSPDIRIGDVVDYGQNIGFRSSTENCDSTGGAGYWPPGPGCPTNVYKSSLITSKPVASEEECATGLGAIGYFSNGTSIYDWNDGQSYNDERVWQHTAANAEIHDLDICLGHAARGDYHHHNYSACLADQLGDVGDAHSPSYGQAADGYPVHGPWHAKDTLAVSSWRTRDYDSADSVTGCGNGERTCLLVDQYDISKGTTSASSDGPSTSEFITSLSKNPISAESGLYFQDYYLDVTEAALGGENLDKHNGHDHGEIGYHYHLTIKANEDDTYTPAFPFTFGPTYKGVLDENSLSSCGSDRDGPTGGMPRGFEEAAVKLNITPAELMEALGAPGRRPDIAAAAAKLGISEDALRTVLPTPPDR